MKPLGSCDWPIHFPFVHAEYEYYHTGILYTVYIMRCKELMVPKYQYKCVGWRWVLGTKACHGHLPDAGRSDQRLNAVYNTLLTCAMSKCGAMFIFEEIHYFWPQSWSVEFNFKRWNAWTNKWNVSWTFVRGSWSRGVGPACSGVCVHQNLTLQMVILTTFSFHTPRNSFI